MSKKISGSPFLEMIVNQEKVVPPEIEKVVPPPELKIVPKPVKPIKSKKKPKSNASIFSKRASRVSQAEIALDLPPPQIVQSDQNEKREMLFKFELMKKKNPQFEIPEYSMGSEINLMRTSYDLFVRRLTIDCTVDNYKQYLTFLSLGIEIIGSRFTKFNFQGLTAHHQSQMNSYEKLLIEIGEKHDPRGKSMLPVEIRLGILLAMNTVIFVASQGAFPPDVAAKFMSSLTSNKNGGNIGKKMRRPDEL